MKVNKKFVAYPVAFAVAMALGTAHAQTTTNATLSAEGQSLGSAPLGLGDIYSKQGHAMRAAANTTGSSQRLPVMTVTLKDDYQLDDEILLTIQGTNVTPNVDRNATTTALDFPNSILCTIPLAQGAGNFKISHPDQFIEPVGSAVTSTLRLRVTQRDASITSTNNATCVIEGVYITDASIAAATVSAGSSSTLQATITADWDAYDGSYVIGRSEGNDPNTSNVKIDDLAAPVVVAVVRNQFEPWAVTKPWDAVIDVQVAGSQYTRLMRLSPPIAAASNQTFDETYSMTDVLQFTSRDRGNGGIGVAGTSAGNVYAGGQTNYFDGAVVSNATFNVTIAGDFNFVRDNNQTSGPIITGGDSATLPADCATAATVTGGNSSVAASTVVRSSGANSAGTTTVTSVTGCSSLSYAFARPAAAAGAGEGGNSMTHTLTATRGNNTSPWWVRQNFALTSASYNYTGFASVGSRNADPLNGTAEDTDTNLDTSAATKAGTTTAASFDAGSQDPGNWTINGTRVFVPYMPFDTGITRILRVSNIMFTDGDSNAPNVSITDPADANLLANRRGVNVSGTDSRTGRTTWAAGTPTEDGAVVLYQVWNDGLAGTAAPATCTFAGTTKAKANATTSLAADFRDGVVGCSGILDANGKGTVAAMITIGAPEQGIEVVSAYNVNGDRVQVINNSNGRNNSDTNAEMGSRRPSGRSDYNSPEDLDDNFTAPN